MGVEGERVFSLVRAGRGYGGGLSTEFKVQEAGRRAATVGLIVESWAVLRRWTIFSYEWASGV